MVFSSRIIRVVFFNSQIFIFVTVYNNNDLANLQMLLQEKEAAYNTLTAEVQSIQAEKGEMVQRLEKADKELFELRAKCRDVEYTINNKEEAIRELERRLATQSSQPTAVELPASDVTPQTAIKVSSLGASKKSRSRGKGGRTSSEVKAPSSEGESNVTNSDGQIASLNSRIVALEKENASLNEQTARLTVVENELTSLREQLDSSEQDKRTLQKRVDLLLTELDSNGNQGKTNSIILLTRDIVENLSSR